MIIHPEIDTTKPSPCIGCGFCCLKAPCVVALRVHGNGIEICPELIWDEVNVRHVCRLMMLSGIKGEEYRKELYAGEGCCSGLNSWRLEPVKNRKNLNTEAENKKIDKIFTPEFQDFLKAVGAQWISGDTLYFILGQFEVSLQKRGYTIEESKIAKKRAMYYLTQHRSKMVEGFLG